MELRVQSMASASLLVSTSSDRSLFEKCICCREMVISQLSRFNNNRASAGIRRMRLSHPPGQLSRPLAIIQAELCGLRAKSCRRQMIARCEVEAINRPSSKTYQIVLELTASVCSSMCRASPLNSAYVPSGGVAPMCCQRFAAPKKPPMQTLMPSTVSDATGFMTAASNPSDTQT